MTTTLMPKQATARHRLRDATHATHERMHGLPHFRSIAEGLLQLPAYVRLLEGLHSYHETIGLAAKARDASHLGSSSRRVKLLAADLHYLGAVLTTPALDWELSDAGQLLGALYVAEGSMLGGRILARQLDYLFSDRSEGRSFFLGTPEDNHNWRKLLSAVEEHYRDGEALAQMVAGAHASFALFEECIGQFG